MITSATNPRIKHVIQLVKSAKLRREEGVYVVEGIKMCLEAPFMDVMEIYASESFMAEHKDVFARYQPEIVSDQIFKKMSDTMTPQGILCVVKQAENDCESLLENHKSGNLRLLVLEGVQDPGNLGTMIRTAEGAGFDAIIADANTVNVYNPKVIRSTMGSIFRVPVIYTDDLKNVLTMLQSSGITLYAAHLKGDSFYNKTAFENRRAILIGNEANGLSDEVSKMADVLVKIPMQGQVESLNAAVAAALLMYKE